MVSKTKSKAASKFKRSAQPAYQNGFSRTNGFSLKRSDPDVHMRTSDTETDDDERDENGGATASNSDHATIEYLAHIQVPNPSLINSNATPIATTSQPQTKLDPSSHTHSSTPYIQLRTSPAAVSSSRVTTPANSITAGPSRRPRPPGRRASGSRRSAADGAASPPTSPSFVQSIAAAPSLISMAYNAISNAGRSAAVKFDRFYCTINSMLSTSKDEKVATKTRTSLNKVVKPVAAVKRAGRITQHRNTSVQQLAVDQVARE
ncbi:hypothetical protein HK102_001540, partial [Quaeritorhiza haematococci]